MVIKFNRKLKAFISDFVTARLIDQFEQFDQFDPRRRLYSEFKSNSVFIYCNNNRNFIGNLLIG